MDDKQFLDEYFERYREVLFDPAIYPSLVRMRDEVLKMRERGGKLIFAGNGGSAAIASHCSVDFTKQGGVRSIDFNEADLITCFANDYGYEHWVEKALEFHASPEDVAVLISSSGKSANIVNAAKKAKQMGLFVVTLSGFERENPLSAEGDLHLWVDSRAYNVIENTHQIWLLSVCDMVIGKAEYGVE